MWLLEHDALLGAPSCDAGILLFGSMIKSVLCKTMADDNVGILFMSLQTIPYILVTIPIYYLVEKFVNKCRPSNRDTLVSNQREEYFQELVASSAKLEAEHAREEEEFTNMIRKLQNECNHLRGQLDTSCSEEDTLDKLRKELNRLLREQKELRQVEQDLSDVEIGDNIDEKLRALEKENEALTSAVENHKAYSPISELDYHVKSFLEAHDNELTIEYLEKIYRTILELRATRSFDEAKAFAQSNYANKINELRTDQLIVGKDLEKMQERHREEFKKLAEARIRYMLEVGYGRLYLDKLRFINDVTEDLMEQMGDDLSASHELNREQISMTSITRSWDHQKVE